MTAAATLPWVADRPATTQERAAYAEVVPDIWAEPAPFLDGLPPVEAFDFALLPATLQPWIGDVCDRMQCPPDFVAVTLMAALGSLIGRKVSIRPQDKTDWTVICNQWALLVGRPGVMKSPAMEAALSSLKRLAAKSAEAYQSAAKDFEVTARVAKLQVESAEKAARAKLGDNPDANIADLLRGETPEPPNMRRYIVNDTSPASLGELLRRNPNGILNYRDELVPFLMSLDREENAEARAFYLTGWNGDSGHTIDRIGCGMHLHIDAVCISLLSSTRPGRIAKYVHAAVKGGSGDDGLIQRFGLTVFPDAAGEWKDVDRLPDTQAWSQYLETHAKRLYASGINQEVTAAKAILAKLRGGHLSKTFSSRDVWRPGWANLTDREQVSAALRLLADLDWIGVSTMRTDGRTATVYTANPKGH